MFYSKTSAYLFQHLRLVHPQATKVRGASACCKDCLLVRGANRAGLPTRGGSILAPASQLKQAEAFGYLSTKLARQGCYSQSHLIRPCSFYEGYWLRINFLPTYVWFYLYVSSQINCNPRLENLIYPWLQGSWHLPKLPPGSLVGGRVRIPVVG